MMEHIKKPTLLLDRNRCLQNINTMSEKIRKQGKIFRPHFKTHQSHTVGRWFRDFGTDRIAVSSVSMASFFARDGWKDITIAFPLNIREIDDISELNDRITLNLLLSHPGMPGILDRKLNRPAGVFVELDAFYGRSGLDVENPDVIENLLKEIKRSPRLQFKGFLIHAGQTYHAGSRTEILSIHSQVLKSIQMIRARFMHQYPEAMVSLGDTPSCSLSSDFRGVDECRPGNFVFYDLTQAGLGVCTEEQIAVSLASPVVASYPARNEVVVYGGGIHLSKESLKDENGNVMFGKVCLQENGLFAPSMEGARVSRLSQEHGIISLPEGLAENFRPGDLLGILPVHSCLTADCMRGYMDTNGKHIDHLQGIPYF